MPTTPKPDLHICINTEQLTELIAGQKVLQKTVETIQTSLNQSFKLSEKHDAEIDTLQEWKAGKHATNGYTTEKFRHIKATHENLEERVETLQTCLNSLKTDTEIIKAAVIADQQRNALNDERSWSTREKIITGIIVGTAVLLISFVITFLWKTFILVR